MFRDQTAGPRYNTTIGNAAFQIVSNFKYLGTPLINQNCVYGKIKRMLGSGLTFMGPCCIADIFPSITNKMQRYTIYLFLWNALHVSGGTYADHKELKTVCTASGTCQTFTAACRYGGRVGTNYSSNSSSIAAHSSKGLTSTRCCTYSFELLMTGGGTAWNM
jgi:hypothetical protein